MTKLFYDKVTSEVVVLPEASLSEGQNRYTDLAKLRRQIEERLRLTPQLVVAIGKLLKLI